MKKALRIFFICLCIISLCPISTFASSQAYSWYCIRNKEHRQPAADANMSFIENYQGYYVDKKLSKNDTTDKVIYLTFDAGYENGNISKILDVLKEEEVSAAFFVLKNLMIKNPDLIQRMKDEGHTVCNHTSNHPDITKFKNVEELKAELEELENLYKNIVGCDMPKYFRPPEGKFNEQSMKFISSLGYKTIFWSFAYADWDNNAQMAESAAKAKIFDNIHNGEVMLLHPTSKTNAAIMKDIIIQLRSQGYRFGTLDELTA